MKSWPHRATLSSDSRMRFVGLVLLCAGLLPAQPAPDKCRLEGKVLNSITGAPVRKAQVILIGRANLRARASAAPSMLVRLTATTDGEGRFVFEGLDAGRYSATPLRDGFRSPAALAQRPELAAPGAGRREARSYPPAGSPWRHFGACSRRGWRSRPRASVRVMTYQPTATGRLALTPGRLAFTNDVGEYRFFDLPPGRYYIRAVAFPRGLPYAVRIERRFLRARLLSGRLRCLDGFRDRTAARPGARRGRHHCAPRTSGDRKRPPGDARGRGAILRPANTRECRPRKPGPAGRLSDPASAGFVRVGSRRQRGWQGVCRPRSAASCKRTISKTSLCRWSRPSI